MQKLRMKSKIHKNILNQPTYWVEAINGMLYEAITEYLESNKFTRTQMAEYLGISKGRMSQILNDGDINFSIEKLVEIILKVGKYPVIQFVDKESFLNEQSKTECSKAVVINLNPIHYCIIPKSMQNKTSQKILNHYEEVFPIENLMQ